MERGTLTVVSDAEVIGAIEAITGLRRPFRLLWAEGRDRSAEQNNLMWMWATEAARQRGDVTPPEVQAMWKLHHGVPLLRADDETFREEYDATFKPLAYETKLRVMRLMDWPITRRMTRRQMTAFLDAVAQDCAEQGITLTQPDADLAEYMERHRGEAA